MRNDEGKKKSDNHVISTAECSRINLLHGKLQNENQITQGDYNINRKMYNKDSHQNPFQKIEMEKVRNKNETIQKETPKSLLKNLHTAMTILVLFKQFLRIVSHIFGPYL